MNKSSCLASALGVTKFTTIIAMNWVTFVVLLKSDLDVQQTHHRAMTIAAAKEIARDAANALAVAKVAARAKADCSQSCGQTC